jgi:protein kinase/serine/threonine-protein kinase
LNRVKQLIHEVHRRSLWQVLGIYVVGGWVVFEVVQTATEGLGLPQWFPAFAALLLLIGLPVVLATAFVQEGIGTTAEPRSVEVAASTDEPQPASGARTLFTWRNAILGGGGAFALWGVVAAGWMLLGGTVAAPEQGEAGTEDDLARAIAVLPFANLSTDEENAFFADGIHEDILTQLSKVADLTVISRTSVLTYRESSKTLREIGDELGVGSIVEGSVRRSGDNVRITAQLIDAETDQHIWADNFDRGLTAANVFGIQTEIARQIAAALRATLSAEEETRIAHVPTTDLSAYDFYIRGREAYQRYVADDNEEAIRLFREAISIDSGYAEPWAGLADAYSQRVQFFGYPIEWADSAEALARYAIELNPEAAPGFKALALSASMRGRTRAALEANLEAIARDPNHHAAANNAGFAYFSLGRYDEAIRWYKRSARLNPGSFGAANTMTVYALVGDEDIARRMYAERVNRESLAPVRRVNFGIILELYARNPSAALRRADAGRTEFSDIPLFLAFDAAVRTAVGDLEGARESAERAFELSPGASLRVLYYDLQTYLGYAMMRTGAEAEGRALLADRGVSIRSQLTAGADRPSFLWELASIHAALGESEEAVRLATQARDLGFQPAVGYVEIEPMMESVRDDPRIVAMFEDSRREIEEQRRRIEAEEIAAGER